MPYVPAWLSTDIPWTCSRCNRTLTEQPVEVHQPGEPGHGFICHACYEDRCLSCDSPRKEGYHYCQKCIDFFWSESGGSSGPKKIKGETA